MQLSFCLQCVYLVSDAEVRLKGKEKKKKKHKRKREKSKRREAMGCRMLRRASNTA